MDDYILGIGGSLEPDSRSEVLLKHMLAALEKQGGCTEMLSLREVGLPLYSEKSKQQALAQSFIDKAARAKAIVLCSPEYHSAISGVLKNALDFLSKDELSHKPVALMAVCGGAIGGTSAINNMATIVASLHGLVLPQHVIVEQSYRNVGEVLESKYLHRVEALAGRLITFSSQYGNNAA
ncbi:NADPH-dependent FMN reductase [Pseudoalteromonas rubra]|uniref:NADPH-dependent FMN reductase n=1 Tax=Pseudoalteromonas rubra TaxID=43658 RepID=UPI0013DD9296|nr:NADPH-dependent FMN reductase [Pseudoalteromonas rubra]